MAVQAAGWGKMPVYPGIKPFILPVLRNPLKRIFGNFFYHLFKIFFKKQMDVYFYHEEHEDNNRINVREAGLFVGNLFSGHGYELVGSPPLILPASRSISAVLFKVIVRHVIKNGADQRSLPLVCACAFFILLIPFYFFCPRIFRRPGYPVNQPQRMELCPASPSIKNSMRCVLFALLTSSQCKKV